MELREYVIRKIADARNLANIHTRKNGVDLPKRRFYISLKKRCDNFIKGSLDDKTIILPGLRGTGKTTALLQLYRYLTEERKMSEDRVLYVSLDEVVELLGSSFYDIAMTYISDVLDETPELLEDRTFLLVDEAHFDKKWQTAVKVLHDRTKNLFMAVTGSSSIAMEMTPDLVRRVVRETVYPLNFSEYLLLKYGYYPPSGTAATIRSAVFEGRFENLNKLYNSIRLSLAKKGSRDVQVEFRNYLEAGGFAFGIEMDKSTVYRKVWEIVEKIVRVDLPPVTSLRTENIPSVMRLITFLAIQKPGGLSIHNLAGKLGVSPTTVSTMLDALEKTHLIFRLLPSNGAGIKVRKPLKYYFATPTINAAIRNLVGGAGGEEAMGILLETLVASYLKRIIDTLSTPYTISYGADKKSVDFVLEQIVTGDKIPIEVTSSLKGSDVKRVRSAISRFRSGHGILITLKGELRIEDDVAILPAALFSFV